MSFVCSLMGIAVFKVKTPVSEIEKINPFESPFIYFFMIFGILMTLVKDYRDEKRRPLLTKNYIGWSILVSVGFSILTALAWEEGLIKRFPAFCIVTFVSALAPALIDRFSNGWVETIGTQTNELLKAIFNGIKNWFNGFFK